MINWKFIQKEYDSGKSYSDLIKEYGIANASLAKARVRGDFKPLSLSDAGKRRAILKPNKKMTDEERKLTSERMKELFKRRPELHPNRKVANNRQKMTYPERLAYDWLKKNNVDFIHNAKIGTYFVDFLIGKTAIEIDGERWHNKEYDDKRDLEIKSLGFDIIRIKALDIIKDKDNLLLQQAVNGKIDQDFLIKFRDNVNKIHKAKHTCKCGNKKFRSAKCCRKCRDKSQKRDKILYINANLNKKNELIKILEENDYNYTTVSKYFNVDSKTIRNRCITLGIPLRKKCFHHPKFTAKDFDKALKAGLKAAEKVERSHAAIHNIPPSVWDIVLD